MSAATILSVVLGLLQFANWITAQIDRAKLKGDIRLELIDEQIAALSARLARTDAIIEKNKTLTDEERERIATED